MQNNYHLLRKLSKEIAQKIANNQWYEGEKNTFLNQEIKKNAMQLLACFSQSKDELVLGFAHQKADFYIKAVLNADFSCLTFPAEFQRAKKNSVDLFKELIGKYVTHIKQYRNERSFGICFENDYQLLFKMHGRRANVVLYQNDKFVISFHKKMENDRYLNITTLDRDIAQSFENFAQQGYDWSIIFPTFGKEINQYLVDTFSENSNLSQNPKQQWDFIQAMLQSFEQDNYYLWHWDTMPELTLLKPAPTTPCLTYHSAIQAYNEFYYNYTHKSTLYQEKNEVLRQLLKRKRQIQSYIEKNQQKIAELEGSLSNEENANLLMAYLHQIKPHATEVQVFDFYHNTNRTIKLKKELSPQKNAEIYYRKAKNQKIETEVLQKNIQRKEQELKDIERHYQQLQAIDNVKELRKYLKMHSLKQENTQENPLQTLFRRFEYQGFEILVGKNAKNNDLLTQKYAYKEDLWLHAKDVSGSHVIIKYKAGQSFPPSVIEKAAQVAAYFSKRSQDSLCPVIVTKRKFVRKTKDLAEGQVIIEKEDILLVVPESF